MKIILTTDDPDAFRWVQQILADGGQVGWRCSVECEGISIKVIEAAIYREAAQ